MAGEPTGIHRADETPGDPERKTNGSTAGSPSFSRYHRMTVRIGLVFLGLFLGLLLAEVGLRVMGYVGDHERINTVYHDGYGQLLKDAWVLKTVFDPRLSDHVNVNGRDVAFEKSPHRTRVVFIGDSGTWGRGVENYESFPIVFETLAAYLGTTDIEVVNAAVSGMSNVTEYRLLADQLVTLDPDVVVMGLFMANDITWNLDDQPLLGPAPTPWRTLDRRLRQRSALAHFLHLQLLVWSSKFRSPRTRSVYEKEITPWNALDDGGLHLFDYVEGEISTYRKQYSPLMDYAFDLLREVLWRCRKLADEEGFQFVVTIIPTSSQIAGRLDIPLAPNALDDLRDAGIEIEIDELDVERPLEVVKNLCAQLGIVSVDPTQGLRRIGAEAAIFPDDDHLSPAGHRIVAVALARHFDGSTGRFVGEPTRLGPR